jgi:cob(I)alamin adenosyltransferase
MCILPVMNDFDSVTTRGGDKGESSLLSGERRRKDDLIFEALGDLDEAFTIIGVARASLGDSDFAQELLTIQKKLLTGGAMLASYPQEPIGNTINEQDIAVIEQKEKEILACIPPQRGFIYPGDNLAAAHVHMARAVCRRLERRVVSCIRERGMADIIVLQKFVNRLSDYLFLVARYIEENTE